MFSCTPGLPHVGKEETDYGISFFSQFPVLYGSHPQMPPEGGAKDALTGKACVETDILDGHSRIFQEITGCCSTTSFISEIIWGKYLKQPERIAILRNAACEILAGEREWTDFEMHGRKVRRYDVGVAAFLCEL